jgi:hypothetical protein
MTSISEWIFRLGHHTPPTVVDSYLSVKHPTSRHHHHLTERVGAQIQYISAANPQSEGAPGERVWDRQQPHLN